MLWFSPSFDPDDSRYIPQFWKPRVLRKNLKDNKDNSLHLAGKYALSFSRATLSENCSLRGYFRAKWRLLFIFVGHGEANSVLLNLCTLSGNVQLTPFVVWTPPLVVSYKVSEWWSERWTEWRSITSVTKKFFCTYTSDHFEIAARYFERTFLFNVLH